VLFANSQAILTREKKAEEKSRVRKTFPQMFLDQGGQVIHKISANGLSGANDIFVIDRRFA